MRSIKNSASAFAFTFAFCVIPVALIAQEQTKPAVVQATLASRLSAATFVGLDTDERFGGGILLHIFKGSQQSLERYRVDKQREFNDLIDPIDRRIDEAKKAKASQEELGTIFLEKQKASMTRSQLAFLPDSSLFRVVSVGLDYVEIQRIGAGDRTVIIPLSKVNRILAYTSPAAASPAE
jgi:hypothetical protein